MVTDSTIVVTIVHDVQVCDLLLFISITIIKH